MKNKEIIPLHYDDRLPRGWHRKVSQRKNGASAGRYEVHIYGPHQKRFRSRNELKAYFEKIGENVLDPDNFDFSVSGTKAKKDNINNRNGQERLNERFQCDLCEEIFPSLIDVKDHINKIHKQNPPKVGIEPKNDVQMHKCHVCGKEFDQYELELHFLTTHSSEMEETLGADSESALGLC